MTRFRPAHYGVNETDLLTSAGLLYPYGPLASAW